MKVKVYLVSLLIAAVIIGCRDEGEATDEVQIEEAYDQEIEDTEEVGADQTADAIEGDPELSTFGTALNSWNVENQLEELQSYTVFAPDNYAYGKIYQLHGQNLVETSSDEITPFHVITQEVSLDYIREGLQVTDTMRLQTVQGGEMKFAKDGKDIVLIGGTGETAKITDSLQAGENQVYVIDAVLLPRALDTEVVVEEE